MNVTNVEKHLNAGDIFTDAEKIKYKSFIVNNNNKGDEFKKKSDFFKDFKKKRFQKLQSTAKFQIDKDVMEEHSKINNATDFFRYYKWTNAPFSEYDEEEN